MGMLTPHAPLGVAGADIGKIAGPTMETCSACQSDSISSYFCERNIKATVNGQRFLTSGYHSVKKNGMVSEVRPAGQCGHGGSRDAKQYQEPVGGINKDTNNRTLSPRYYLHEEASGQAQRASLFV